jgi:hypothetical protein
LIRNSRNPRPFGGRGFRSSGGNTSILTDTLRLGATVDGKSGRTPAKICHVQAGPAEIDFMNQLPPPVVNSLDETWPAQYANGGQLGQSKCMAIDSAVRKSLQA